MKIKNLLSLIVSVITASATILTPSGAEIPISLLTYLDCPIGDVLCKNGKVSTCVVRSNSCRYGNPDILGELLHDEGYDIGNLTPKDFCDIYLEVCDMIMKYDPPLTDDYIYNYKRYFTCHIEDSMCIYGQTTSCQAVVKKCWDIYPTQACEQLSIVCDNIKTGVIPIFASSTQLKTLSGENIPDSLLTYLECPIGDVICKNGKGSTCTARSNICRGSSPETLAEGLANNGYGDIDGLSPEKFCKIHLEVCDMIMDYNPPLNGDDIYNLDKYLTCDVDDSICQYGKRSNCKAVLELCWKSYSIEACQALSNTCDKINGSDRRNDRRSSTTPSKSITKKYSTKSSTTKRSTTKSTTKRKTSKSTTSKKTTFKRSTEKTKTISKKSTAKTETNSQKRTKKTKSTTEKATTIYRKTNITKTISKKSTSRQNTKTKSKTNKKLSSTK